MSKFFSRIPAVLLFAAILFAKTASAATNTWTGATSTDWATATNWSLGTVPVAGDDVVVPNVANKPVIGAAAVAKSVVVNAGSSLTVQAAGSLDINGSTGAALENFGTLDNNGTIRIGNTVAIGSQGMIHRVGATFNNKPGSLTQIDRTGNFEAFYTAGTVNNEATIAIGSIAAVTGNGVSIDVPTGKFINTAGSLLTINAATVAGMENLGTLDNSGTIRIGNLTAIGIQGLVHRLGATLYNKPGGLIRIDRTSAFQAFYTAGVVHNEATIEIGSVAAVTGVGLFIDAVTGIFNNYATGLLTINRATGFGMENLGTLDNSGTIRAGNIASNAASSIVHRSGGTFNNRAGGLIQIDRAMGGEAFYTSGVANNRGAIEIGLIATVTGTGVSVDAGGIFNNSPGGTVQIDRTDAFGLINRGTVNNSSTVTMGATVGVGQDCINNLDGGAINNNPGGVMNLNRSFGNGIWNSNNGNIQNSGDIRIGALAVTGITGILNYATIGNNAGGRIFVDRPAGSGILSDGAGASVTNSGEIWVGSLFAVPGQGVQNSGSSTFANNASGKVNIDRTGTNGFINLSGGTATNSGAITIGALPFSAGGTALRNEAAFNNNFGGTIALDRSTNSGIYQASGLFTNSGAITIGGTASPGAVGLHDDASFTNTASGTIKIDRSAGAAVEHFGGTFTNAGGITIGSMAAAGFQGIYNRATFLNNTGGLIAVSQLVQNGIWNELGTFTNAASITIGAAGGMGGSAILNQATFNNSPCAALINIVSNNAVSNVGTFTNAGLITENASGNSSISTNTGIVQNLNGGTFTIGTNTGTLTTCAQPQNACIPIGYGVAPSAACMQAFCIGDSPTVGSLAPNGPGYLWYSSANSTTPLAAGTALVNGGVYFVSQIVAGCETMRARVNVVVTTPAPGKVCIGGCSN